MGEQKQTYFDKLDEQVNSESFAQAEVVGEETTTSRIGAIALRWFLAVALFAVFAIIAAVVRVW